MEQSIKSERAMKLADVVNPKYKNMKEFIMASREYFQTKSEHAADLVNRYLQLLSVTIDISIFDPQNAVFPEFFIALYELLSNLEPRSSMAWGCVNVLTVACRHPASRQALIHTYQFLPPLSRLLSDNLIFEKKVKLLSLMQELTCGIKLTWQIPHLPHLFNTLTKWMESAEEEVILLALGVLVNLCYKNLPAIYTLTRCIDMKKFIRTCISMNAPRLEVYVCKMLIILEHVHGNIPDSTLLKMTQVTFKSIGEAVNAGDSILLRQVVDFFMDIYNQNEHRNTLKNYRDYYLEVERLLQIVESNIVRASPSGDQRHDPECIATIFEFLHVIIEMKMEELAPLHKKLIDVALKWIHTYLVCMEALAVITTIAVNTTEPAILEPLLMAVPIFALALDNEGDSTERNRRLSAIMQLFFVLVDHRKFRTKILENLNQKALLKIFAPLLNDKDKDEASVFSDTDVFVYVLALVEKLARFDDENWRKTQQDLFSLPQIHAVFAQGLFNGSHKVKSLIMRIARSESFPYDQVAQTMVNMHVNHFQIQSAPCPPPQELPSNLFYPLLSVAQSEKLEDLIHKLKTALAQNNLPNISTSNVMELYEYKIASLSHAERVAMTNAEAASQRCTQLQHRMAQITSELSRANQVCFHTQQQFENVSAEKEDYVKKCKEMQNKIESEKGKCNMLKSQLVLKEKVVEEKEYLVENLTKKLNSLEEDKLRAEEELNEAVAKLQGDVGEMEGQLKKKEELLAKSSSNNEYLRQQLHQTQKTLATTEHELAAKKEELTVVIKELEANKGIVEAITKLATRQNP